MASKFDPYLDQVIAWRRKLSTWEDIAGKISADGVKCSRSQVYEWFKRRARKAEKICREMEALDNLGKRKQAWGGGVLPAESGSPVQRERKPASGGFSETSEMSEEQLTEILGEQESDDPFENKNWD